MNRKRLILAALLGVLALCLVYAYVESPRLEKAPPRVVSKRTVADKLLTKGDQKRNDSRIDFSYLVLSEDEFPGAKRDIFSFGKKKRPKKKTPPPVVVAPTPEVVEIDVPEVTPIELVQKSLSRFTFLGFMDKGGEKTVFLSSGGDLFLVKAGETFGVDREFYVNAIEGNQLQVTHKDQGSLIEIPLIEKKKLRAAVSAPVTVSPPPLAQPTQNKRVFKPQAKKRPPVATPEEEKVLKDLVEEYGSEDDQEKNPVEVDAVEGDVNGANQ